MTDSFWRPLCAATRAAVADQNVFLSETGRWCSRDQVVCRPWPGGLGYVSSSLLRSTLGVEFAENDTLSSFGVKSVDVHMMIALLENGVLAAQLRADAAPVFADLQNLWIACEEVALPSGLQLIRDTSL